MATEKKYILAIDSKLFKKQRQDLNNFLTLSDYAIDCGAIKKKEVNSLQGIQNLLDSISDQLAEKEQDEKIFPNGFDSWQNTHYHIAGAIAMNPEDAHNKVNNIYDSQGTFGLYDFADTLTTKFEEKHKGHTWGIDDPHEFFITLDDFIEEEFKN